MKHKDLIVGLRYRAKLNNTMTIVRLDDIKSYTSSSGELVTNYVVYHFTTKKMFVIKSSEDFRECVSKVIPEGKVVVEQRKPSLADRIRETKANSAPVPPHVMIEANAGTGKTSTLIQGLRRLRGMKTEFSPTEEQLAIWDQMSLSGSSSSFGFVAFNRSVANKLKHEVPPGVRAMTVHGLGFSACHKRWKLRDGDDAVDGWKVKDLLCKRIGVTRQQLRDEAHEKDNNLVSLCDKLIGLCKQGLLDGSQEDINYLADWYDFMLPHDLTDKIYKLVPEVLDDCATIKDFDTIDHNDMVWLPVRHKLKDYVRRYDNLCIDEFQDTTACQQELAMMCADRLLNCYDRRQAIYGFAGSDVRAIDNMMKRLVSTDRGCVTLSLTMTRRCGKRIVKEVLDIVPSFRYAESNPEGFIQSVSLGFGKSKVETVRDRECSCGYRWCSPSSIQQDAEAYCPSCGSKDLKSHTTKIGYRHMIKPGDMIICRVNAPLIGECFRLLKEGTKATILGRNIGAGLLSLIKSIGAYSLPELVQGLETWYEVELAKENAKKNPSEMKLINIYDKFKCLLEFCENRQTIDEVIDWINKLFTDEGQDDSVILCSGHKSKGLEANRVFIYQPKGAECPHPMATTAWQIEQEWNLWYIMRTRAMRELYYLA